ncbi:hypothetical protein PO909_032536 [Leuciscus waleckii]
MSSGMKDETLHPHSKKVSSPVFESFGFCEYDSLIIPVLQDLPINIMAHFAQLVRNGASNAKVDDMHHLMLLLQRPDQHSVRMSSPDPFQEVVDALKRALSSTTSASPVTTSPSPPVASSPVANPASYSGLAEDCDGFLLQCSLALEMQSPRFPTERAKVAFIISLLTGRALHWAQTIWNQNTTIKQTLINFISHFRDVFEIPDGDSSVGVQLYHLNQDKDSVSDYTLKFRTLAAASGWNERCHGAGTVHSSRHPN